MDNRLFTSIPTTLVVLFISLFGSMKSVADDGELWVSASYKAWQSEDKATKVSLYAESRFRDDAGELYGAFVGPIVRHKVNDNLEIGGAFKLINFRNSNSTYDPRMRVELEATPKFSFGESEQFKVSFRNRYELFKNTGHDDLRRMRHRLEFCGKISGSELFQGWCTNHELIYNLHSGSYNLSQYRFIPIGFKLRATEGMSVNVFYMLFRRNNTNGDYSHTLGLNFAF